jgi:hypothetical protein
MSGKELDTDKRIESAGGRLIVIAGAAGLAWGIMSLFYRFDALAVVLATVLVLFAGQLAMLAHLLGQPATDPARAEIAAYVALTCLADGLVCVWLNRTGYAPIDWANLWAPPARA